MFSWDTLSITNGGCRVALSISQKACLAENCIILLQPIPQDKASPSGRLRAVVALNDYEIDGRSRQSEWTVAGLRFKRVSNDEPLYSVRIGIQYRAVGLLKGDTITWVWIGSHDDYERLLAE